MNKKKALASCTGFINCDGLLGYFPFRAANYLVGTGEYHYHQSCCWGYILRKNKRWLSMAGNYCKEVAEDLKNNGGEYEKNKAMQWMFKRW